MKKKLCITFAAVLVFCAGCHGRAPVNDETTQAVQEETEGTQEDSQMCIRDSSSSVLELPVRWQ